MWSCFWVAAGRQCYKDEAWMVQAYKAVWYNGCLPIRAGLDELTSSSLYLRTLRDSNVASVKEGMAPR
jgi:hypothetical protein